MIDAKNFFDLTEKNYKVTNEIIIKIVTSQGGDYTTACFLDYSYIKKTYKTIAIDLRKQQALDADPRAIHQINFITNLDRDVKNKNIYYF